MAIEFARIEVVSRKDGKNACCKGAYNARAKVIDEKTGVVFDFSKEGDNVYHEILLPEHVDEKFKNVAALMNAVEKTEKRKDSQLLKEAVIALPDDKELNLEDRIEIIRRIVAKMGWVESGVAVQIDIHKPHDGEKNWHAHILILLRRFNIDGKELFSLKARDLNPEFKNSKDGKGFIIPEEQLLKDVSRDTINEYFKELGLSNRVDPTGIVPQEHIGPVRLRSSLNKGADRNEERRRANIEFLNSGDRLLGHVTKQMSVFNRADLQRGVKILPDKEERERVVDEALNSKDILVLYDTNGQETGYYTTKEVRAEEQKLIRLSSYVANSENVFNNMNSTKKGITNTVFNSHKEGLTSEQQEALEQLLTNDCGIRILRGRAGAGKSEVLGRFASIANDMGINVIGLAPTHKAKLELKARGYEEVDTIKGLLFKYRNGRAFIPKGAVLVVDEAGMVGNDDYTELLKLAANRKCNPILAGDERQLASIQRGGMYEVFAEKYGSSLISDIRRQKQGWAKSVAMALSNGEVRSGIGVLEEQGKIVRNASSEESINALVQDWGKSSEKIEHKLIIAVKNADVDLINEAARGYLIKKGRISSAGFRIQGKTYAKGDRIIIKETSKDLGFTNGDFGIIEKLERELCVIRLDGHGGEEGRKIEFDPRRYQGFRHGYATTVYKSQGASISEVFVYHNGYSGSRNAYVVLSRCINDMKLYINDEFTRGQEHLIKQLGHDAEVGSSLSYMVKEEYEKARQDEERGKTTFGKLGKWVRSKATEIGDRWSSNREYYEYEAPVITHSKVEEVLEQVATAVSLPEAKENRGELALAVGAENIRLRSVGMGRVENMTVSSVSNKTADISKPTKKERFYEQAERSRNKEQKQTKELRDYSQEMAALKGAIEHNSDRIARDLLGEPNKKLSKGSVYRYGSRGSLAVHVRGAKAGTWYDFEAGSGGDMFALVQRERGGEFKDSAEYLKDMFGTAKARTLKLVYDNELEEKYAKHVKAGEQREKEEALKVKAVEKLYSRAKEIKETSIANRYLREVRNIKLETYLGEDIKTAGIYHQNDGEEKGSYLPALVAFARDKEGKVTGGQQILLDKKTGGKAKIELPKKSFGKIAGSFVEVGNIANAKEEHKAERITIIAEGIETALSIGQAFEKQDINVKILCSLGVSNIRNYQAEDGEKIIIAADNDGKNAVSNKTIENAKKELEGGKGAFVEIVKPNKEGDFNDVLKEQGVEKIQESFAKAMEKHQAKTVEEYLKASGTEKFENALDKQAIADLKYLEKYKIDQEKIVKAFRHSSLQGTIELDNTRKEVTIAEEFIENKNNEGKAILDEMQSFGGKINKTETIKALTTKTEEEKLEHLHEIRDKHYMQVQREEIAIQKAKAYDPKELLAALTKEQEFYQALGKNLKSKHVDEHTMSLIKQADLNQQNKTLEQLNKIVGFHIDKGISKPEYVAGILKNAEKPEGIQSACQSLIKSYQVHAVKELQKCLDGIHAGKIVSMDGKKFDCQIKFLEHVLDSHKHNEFLPRQTIERAHAKLLERHLEKDFGLSI